MSMKKWLRLSGVVFGALLITALGIDASDTLHGSTGTLLSRVIATDTNACPTGMLSVDTISTLTCVDIYEASPGKNCPVSYPSQTINTQQNIESNECNVESKPDVKPWGYITRDQAMQMCARDGKRLPTSAEWYQLSLSMRNIEQTCNVQSKNVSDTGAFDECVSTQGIHDLVGNVWEWMSDDVINGIYNTRSVPSSGYVSQVDAQGVAVSVSTEAQDLFEKDYFWSRADGAYGMIRGGYYDSGSDAGIYTIHADTLPTTASIGIGFRCVK